MSTKTFSLPNLFGFSPPIVRSEHRVSGVTSRSPLRQETHRPAITKSRVRTSSLSRATRSVSLIATAQSNRNWVGLSLAVGVVGLSIFYMFGVNGNVATGYEMHRAQVKLEKAQLENKRLMVKTAEVGSMTQIQNEAIAEKLVSITSEEYLQPNHLSER